MAQKRNLNINPYYDDFDSQKNFYKVLFKPGFPVQSRELTTLQSILQNQVESFGSHIFKEGSMVIPGGVTYDGNFYAVKLNNSNFGVDVSLYINQLIGKKITGQSSGVTAIVQYVALTSSPNIDDLTIYVKYIDSNDNFVSSEFEDGESLITDETITYGNTSINAGTVFASVLEESATFTGSAVSIEDGVYFVRGYFVNVSKQTILLDEYTNTPSYRVGLRIDELITTAKDDSSLYDNAKGFSNYAAPGSDRLKINLTLTKKLLTDTNDTDFIEVLKLNNGKIKKIQSKTQYNLIKDYLALRTYEESGNYSTEPFDISLHNSLNNKLGNDGLFFENQKTDDLNDPSDDLMSVMVSPGRAYVKGYDVENTGTKIIDVKKPRDVKTVEVTNVPFRMGNLLRVNNVKGSPILGSTINLMGELREDSSATIVGKARVYSFNLTDSKYQNSSTNWDLYLFDVQTYTKLTLSTGDAISATSFVKGKYSGASGYVDSESNPDITLIQTSGTFVEGEPLIVNGIDNPRTINSITVYGTSDIKSVKNVSDTDFEADCLLEDFPLPNGIRSIFVNSNNEATSSGGNFTGLKVGSILKLKKSGDTPFFAKVNQVNSTTVGLSSIGTSDVTGVYRYNYTTSTSYENVTVGSPIFRNQESAYLYEQLPDTNVSSVNLSKSDLSVSVRLSGETLTNNKLELSTSDTNISSIGNVSFKSFTPSRYSITDSSGTPIELTSDDIEEDGNDTNTFTVKSGVIGGSAPYNVNVTLTKFGVKNKIKTYKRSSTLTVDKTRSSLNTATSQLTTSNYYGLRIEDEEISLNVPDVVKVLAIYESTGTSTPTLDELEFDTTSNVKADVIIGENIVSDTNNKVVARVVQNSSINSNLLNDNTLGIVYLTKDRFVNGEKVRFKESNVVSTIKSINSRADAGKYKDITTSYLLDKGQKEQYYDYSRIIRGENTPIPSRKLLIVFDNYEVSSSDDGDAFTVLSYGKDRFAEDIPLLGKKGIRATDTIDFRPRVPNFNVSTATRSPFDFNSRTLTLQNIISPNEDSSIGYDFYLGRIDKLYIDKLGKFVVKEGLPSVDPKSPISSNQDMMELATITLPPYLYNPKNAEISLTDNKRYTMRDIGLLEDRIDNLEEVTSLSLLEVNTQSLQIKDSEGNDRFKSGFFVDDFKNDSLIDLNVSTVVVDSANNELTPIISSNTLKNEIVSESIIPSSEIDFSSNFNLLDSNVQKTGNCVTLKYDSIGWIEQPLATKVENVNPFHVVSYIGSLKLTPSTDRWVRTIRLNSRTQSGGTIFAGGSGAAVRVSTFSSTRDVLVASGAEEYMRSRNVEFSTKNIKPLTRFYHFLDGNGGLDFIPKLIEISNDNTLVNYGSSGTFKVGETVNGTVNGETLIKFRVASSNHKYGPFNAPTTKFNINPYLKSENLFDDYSQSSKVLNVDTFALSEEAQGNYFGYLTVGMKLEGEDSGAVAFVKDLRLISDNYGDLLGSFFIRNPFEDPAPTIRIGTGTKNYRITNSSTNQKPLPGSKLISSAETTYKSEGTWQQRRFVTTNTTVVTYYDPLAQSFSVGGNIEAPDLNGENDDSNGAFLTAVDLFFGSKPSTNDPVRIEIRTVELGTPTRVVVGEPKVLRPEDVTISTTGDLPTKVVFDSPIYLEPGREYAIVAVAETTDQYELWIAEMGEKTKNTQTLPDAEAVRYTKQFALGSLFRSQNGSIWTANQYQDMKFKLYKAKFTASSGSAYFYNSPLSEGNGYVRVLGNNPIETLPKTGSLLVSSIVDPTLVGLLVPGRKLAGSSSGSAVITGIGRTVDTVSVASGGSNYNAGTRGTITITGSGSGLTLTIVETGGVINTATPVNLGNGYKTGDIVTIDNGTDGTGSGARLVIGADIGSSGPIDAIHISNIQGELSNSTGKEFSNSDTLKYYDNSNAIVTTSPAVTISAIVQPSTESDGDHIRVNHFNHGMYDQRNKVVLKDVQSNYPPTVLSSNLTSGETSTISVGSTSIFATFEGVPVNASTNPGYIKIENEIIAYGSVNNDNTLSILNNGRGIDNTNTIIHEKGAAVYKYELNGVSLRRINTDHDISNINITSDGYHLKVSRDSSKGISREVDGTYPQLSFEDHSFLGGSNIKASENIIFGEIIPTYDIVTPGSSTSVDGFVRTITGTSIDSTGESSFVDKGFEPVELNRLNKFNSTRMICSQKNESEYLSDLPRNKSLTTQIRLSTTDENLSPIVYLDNASSELRSPRLNNPIENFATDNRVNSMEFDPHAAVYVSNTVNLQKPANSLRVLLSAYRHSSSDIRVLYQLVKADSSEVDQEFELFPGYDNITSLNENGFSVIDSSKNSGRPDVEVRSSLDNEFLEYQFTADNLELFTGYRIKIVMAGNNSAYYPRIKDLRTIALR